MSKRDNATLSALAVMFIGLITAAYVRGIFGGLILFGSLFLGCHIFYLIDD